MADKAIQDLPRVDRLEVDDLLVVGDASNGYNAHAATGAIMRILVKEQASEAVAEIESKVSEASQAATSAAGSADAAQQYAQNATDSAEQSATSAQQSETSATDAQGYANSASEKATLSQSWAVGGTGSREDEDTDNAKYWAEQAHNAAGGGVTTFNGRTGAVIPQAGDYTPDMVGAVGVVIGVPAGNIPMFTDSGTLQNSGKKITDFEPSALIHDLSLYVNSFSGDDKNNGLSAEHPKKTIQSAVDVIPKLLTGGRALINISPGEYEEDVYIRGLTGVGSVQESVYLSSTGAAEETSIVGSIKIAGTAPVWIRNLTIKSGGKDVPLLDCYFSSVSVTGCVLDAANISGTSAAVKSTVGNLNMRNSSISNAKSLAMSASGILIALGLTGSGNKTGIQNSDAIGRAGIVSVNKLSQDFAETIFVKVGGGFIVENGVVV